MRRVRSVVSRTAVVTVTLRVSHAMSDKRAWDEYSHRRELQSAGWKVDQADKIEFNSGSETVRHAVCKTVAAMYLKQEKGLRVDSEVEHSERGEIDVIGYSGEGAAIAVECETSPTDDVVGDKLERYVEGTPFRDMFLLNVTEMPENIMDAYEWVGDNL